jgi:hypothetical protein
VAAKIFLSRNGGTAPFLVRYRGTERRRDPQPNSPIRRYIMKGAALWLLGLPIPLIILLYVFNVI